MTSTTFAGVPTVALDQMPDDRLRLLLHGPQGSGKSYTSSSIAELGPTLFLDVIGEKGTKSFRGSPWEKNVTVMRPTSVQQLDDVYWQLASGDHPYQAVVLDSISAVQKTALRFLLGYEETAVREIRKGTAPADQRTWGRVAEIMTDIATFWFGLADGDRPKPLHVVMTSQSKNLEDDEGTTRAYPDVSPASRNILLASASYVLYNDQEQVFTDEGEPESRFIVRMGFDPRYYTKARVPVHLQGKIPAILGRNQALTLSRLCAALQIPTGNK